MEASRAKRVERQQARLRDRGGYARFPSFLLVWLNVFTAEAFSSLLNIMLSWIFSSLAVSTANPPPGLPPPVDHGVVLPLPFAKGPSRRASAKTQTTLLLSSLLQRRRRNVENQQSRERPIVPRNCSISESQVCNVVYSPPTPLYAPFSGPSKPPGPAKAKTARSAKAAKKRIPLGTSPSPYPHCRPLIPLLCWHRRAPHRPGFTRTWPIETMYVRLCYCCHPSLTLLRKLYHRESATPKARLANRLK